MHAVKKKKLALLVRAVAPALLGGCRLHPQKLPLHIQNSPVSLSFCHPSFLLISGLPQALVRFGDTALIDRQFLIARTHTHLHTRGAHTLYTHYTHTHHTHAPIPAPAPAPAPASAYPQAHLISWEGSYLGKTSENSDPSWRNPRPSPDAVLIGAIPSALKPSRPSLGHSGDSFHGSRQQSRFLDDAEPNS